MKKLGNAKPCFLCLLTGTRANICLSGDQIEHHSNAPLEEKQLQIVVVQ
jgi:hypothetical protein